MFVTYNIPAMWIGAHSEAWPQDVLKRSYFTDHLCGDETDRACPGPALRSIHVSPTGEAVVPDGTTLPDPVPYERPN